MQVALTKISVQLTQREPVSQVQPDASPRQEPGRKLDELPSCCRMCVQVCVLGLGWGRHQEGGVVMSRRGGTPIGISQIFRAKSEWAQENDGCGQVFLACRVFSVCKGNKG